MVPAPSSPYTWDYWITSPSDYVDLTCLMPNSIYILLKASWDATLQDVKEELWDRAAKYPLNGMLHDMSEYVFQFENSLAVLEEVDDETKRLRDIKPICGVLLIVERSIERPGEQLLNTQISHLIGKGLNEFDKLRSSEVNNFRMRMRYIAEENALKVAQFTPMERLQYQSPVRLAESAVLPPTLASHLNNNCFILVTQVANTEFSFTSNVPMMRTPQQHIENILRKKANSLNIRGDHPRAYVLKVCGMEEYLLGDYPLIQFLHIQETLARDGVPQVMTVSADKVPVFKPHENSLIYHDIPERRRLTSEHSNTIRRKKTYHESSWNIDKNYSCTVQSVERLNVDPGRHVEVVCQAGIFHGGKSLCEPQKTLPVPVSKQNEARWDQEIHFPIKVYNIPRNARICFAIYEVAKLKGKRKKDPNKIFKNKLAWANTMIFDYREHLRTDANTLYMWTHVADETQGDDLLLHSLGTVYPNPNTDSCTAMQVRFSHYDCQHPILFPSLEVVKEYGKENDSVDKMSRVTVDFEQLKATAEKDAMYEMHEQEKKDLWAAREHFRTSAPHLLPKLLSCVEWGERGEAACAARALAAWPLLPLESALELLDYTYADRTVRDFAVRCLAPINDEELMLYFLQLVQALKHESYLSCGLVDFLLRRAYNNMTVGHYLFWHLRSEMHMPAVCLRFGLVLEAYCRGCRDHIGVLMRQIKCLDKLKWASATARKRKDLSRSRSSLQGCLDEPHCRDTLTDFCSPLNPRLFCKRIRTDNCKVMDSKMKPLMLEFDNYDLIGPKVRIIMKIGDDLRQDMFTLQMLRIMDRIWKSEGYDFRLNPYNCISMEYLTGMIEVVDGAETVANVQKQGAIFTATSTISKVNLYQWLRDQHTDDSVFNKALREFRMSCAGYCVATYVLGIADRHPDNIMLTKTGQLFHIDFGHFLGHFKQKFGFRRERVPFVLTHDFIHVINGGQRGSGVKEPADFKRFRDNCETAFKILRRHGHLILSLFSMMISTGLPELSSEKDLQYLRETLVLDLTEEKAIEHFRLKFMEAVGNAWTTSFNWAFHNFDKNN